MYNKIDLRDIPAEDLKEVDLDRVDLDAPAPDFEPHRQYYFMAKCRQYVKAMEEKTGRRMTFFTQTFGCQMNARDSEKLIGILEQAGYQMTETEQADLVIYNTCTVRERK